MAGTAGRSRRASRSEFAAIEIAGGLLPPEILSRAAAGELPGQREEDYAVPRGLKLRDEMARYYHMALAQHEHFVGLRIDNASAPLVFVPALLRDCFGFAAIEEKAPLTLAGRHFPVRHFSHGNKVPIIIAPRAEEGSRRSGIDEPLEMFGDGSRRRSAAQLLQEYLNADENALWGIATDGLTLRLMRDNASLTRPAFIEVNLERIFAEGLFADFSALWLLLHASRFGGAGGAPSDCPLERWRERAETDGSAARDKLRLGVEAALVELGSGFLEHPANAGLRNRLKKGELKRQGYYELLLHLVYRLIFLLAAEDRGLLHAPGASEAARRAWRGGYSVGRLRERAVRHAAHDNHHDVWEGLQALFTALARGEPRLGLTALGGLFNPLGLAALGEARITNRRLLKAIWRLTWFRPEGQPLSRVNWRDMQTEELGSVYESLLELIPVLNVDSRHFSFAAGLENNKGKKGKKKGKGNERKQTGSYYTPDSLVQLLLRETLDPVLDAAEARNPDDPAAEILKLAIIDPACGSGHFLLGAARRAAARIARHRAEGPPGQEEFQHALREVVSRCIYGVDRNPMAVELARVALWIEALEPGKPLSFLDNHIRCGDSLIGVHDFALLRAGVPDEAFDTLTGDDKAVAKAYAAINKTQREGKAATGLFAELRMPTEIATGAEKIAAMPEETLKEVEAKEKAFRALISGPLWLRLKAACDMYTAAFLCPKTGKIPDARKPAALPVPTTEAVWRTAGGGDIRTDVLAGAIDAAEAARAFHWPLEFPAIMTRGGFDAVIGNPPWERIKLQEQEFFAVRDAEIAGAANKAEREKLIKALKKAEPGTPQARLLAEFEIAKRTAEAASVFVRKSGRFPLTGTGDVNTYALFAEHFSTLARETGETQGRAGAIVPTGIATDSSTSAFFGDLVASERLTALYDFENRNKLFAAVDSRVKFSVLAIGPARRAKFAAFLLATDHLEEVERRIELTVEDFRLFNPNTLTAPLFRAKADRDLTRKLYNAAPVLIRERAGHTDGDENPWGITIQSRLWHMAEDSAWFRTTAQLSDSGCIQDGLDWRHKDGRRYIRLFEAKMIHHFDHRFASYAGLEARPKDGTLPQTPEGLKAGPDYEAEPWYWVPEEETRLRVARVPARLKQNYRKENGEGCLKVLAEWVLGTLPPDDLARPAIAATRAAALLRDVLGERAMSRDVTGTNFAKWLGKALPGAKAMQRETPLTADDLAFLRDGPVDPLELTGAFLDRKQPRWLMGWRDITNATNERTVIGGIFPKAGSGHNLPVWHPNYELGGRLIAALVAHVSSITLDYAARQKVAGTHLNFFYAQQLPVLAPDQFTREDLIFLTPRVLELTYTSHSMRPWAEDLGHSGPPFEFAPARRALLRAELDAFFALKYGLEKDELRYILDPASVKGADYPSVTFPGLKRNEEAAFSGEYRTQTLVLEAWGRLVESQIASTPIRVKVPEIAKAAALPDGAWARPALPGDTGAALAAILKAIPGATPIRQIRLAAALILEPRLLVPLLPADKATEWQRLVGPEADPLTGNVIQFASRINTHWAKAVIQHRGNGRLVEDLERETWAPGPGLDLIETASWPDGRARFVFDALQSMNLESDSLPDEVQEWIENAEAA